MRFFNPHEEISVNTLLKQSFELEMRIALEAFATGDLDSAFRRLERAHILGQRHTWPHIRSHLWMLRVGFARRDPREMLGQAVRIAAAAVFSRIWVPVGNTGGANISALRSMPVPADLQGLLDADASAPAAA